MTKKLLLEGTGGSFIYQEDGEPPDHFDYVCAADVAVEFTEVRLLQPLSLADAHSPNDLPYRLVLGLGVTPSIWINVTHLQRPWPMALWCPPRQSLLVKIRTAESYAASKSLPVRIAWQISSMQPDCALPQNRQPKMIPLKPGSPCRCYPGLGHEQSCPWLRYHQAREQLVANIRKHGQEAHACDDAIGVWLNGRWWRVVGGNARSPSLLVWPEQDARYPNGLCPKCEDPVVRATSNAGIAEGSRGCANCGWLDPTSLGR
jgi:hypothetical protein